MLDGMRSGRPGDQRGFIHKKILGGISTIAGVASAVGIPGVGAVSRVAGAFSGRTVPRTQTARVTQFSQAEKQLGRQLKFAGAVPSSRALASRVPDIPGFLPCVLPWRIDPRTGDCRLFVGDQTGVDDTPMGETIMGRYGAGLVPGNRVIDRAVCLKGMQLGNDGVCYNKSQISNKQRMWPAGRRPLLTGGDMRAISIAARAGTRMDKATSRLRKLGMMKKPPAARKAPAPTQHQRLLEAHVTK